MFCQRMERTAAVQPSENTSSILPVPAVPDSDPEARAWRQRDLMADESVLFYTLSSEARKEIADGIAFAEANWLTV